MPTILIVEDERELRKALSINFKNNGFEVLEAGNGKEGLKIALEKNPDVILLDLLMPIMSGDQMLKALRQNEGGRSVPVVILTNLNPEAEEISQINPYYPAYYLIKSSVSGSEIVSKIKEVLEGDHKKVDYPTNF